MRPNPPAKSNLYMRLVPTIRSRNSVENLNFLTVERPIISDIGLQTFSLSSLTDIFKMGKGLLFFAGVSRVRFSNVILQQQKREYYLLVQYAN